ncbi:MAG TPA: hypothetical protein VND21_09355, partial [Planctomycetota bacterium]|nr:hypothetical protein [Planctomycetota bacterium]
MAGIFAGTLVAACAIGRVPGAVPCAIGDRPPAPGTEHTDLSEPRPALATPPPPPAGIEQRSLRDGRVARENWDGW